MNIRWDAVVDRSVADFGRIPSSLPTRSAVNQPERPTQARVQLFGALASLSAERTFVLEVNSVTTLADVFAFVGERIGDWFFAHVVDENGAKRKHCRVFVGGYPIEDLHVPLSATAGLCDIEIILLVAPEGG
jgi:hypothetical protein